MSETFNTFSYHHLIRSIIPEIILGLKHFCYDIDVHFLYTKPYNHSLTTQVYLTKFIRQHLRFGDTLYPVTYGIWLIITHRTNPTIRKLIPHRLTQLILHNLKNHIIPNRIYFQSLNIKSSDTNTDYLLCKIVEEYEKGLEAFFKEPFSKIKNVNDKEYIKSNYPITYINVDNKKSVLQEIDLFNESTLSNYQNKKIIKNKLINSEKLILNLKNFNSFNFEKKLSYIISFFNKSNIIINIISSKKDINLLLKLRNIGISICGNENDINYVINNKYNINIFEYINLSGDFIRNIPYNPKFEAIFDTTIFLANKFKINLIANNIKSDNEKIFLRSKSIKIQNINY